MVNLILIRHGESEWNLENRFTGWTDVQLTVKGKNEANIAAKKLIENKYQLNSFNTSILKRAIQTSNIIASEIHFPKKDIQLNWELNERHYGALQGLNKSETAKLYGENQVKKWRRSFNDSPPILDKDDNRHPRFNKKFVALNCQLPSGESLKDVVSRLMPFWGKYFEYILEKGGDHIIVAHSNSLRAIIMILDKLSENEIVSINIPTGVPLVYSFQKGIITEKKYLISQDELKAKQDKIKNQGKAK